MQKRHIAAWLLLDVYLPMLLLSSFHIHAQGEVDATTCSECVQHQCHGHLSQFAGELHQCVLCQILSLTYVATTAAAVVFCLSSKKVLRVGLAQNVCLNPRGCVCLRAPPLK